MKLKLIVIFLSVVLILLMFGVGVVSGDGDAGYPAPENEGYPIDMGYPIQDEILGYPIFEGVPDGFYITSSPEINTYSNPVQVQPIMPEYRNGRNLWQELVYKWNELMTKFPKLFELMK